MAAPKPNRICVPGSTSELHRVRAFVEARARQSGVGEQGVYNITLAVDEACSNVIRHAYKHDQGREFCVTIEINDNELIIEISDSGDAFDPMTIRTPNMKEYFENFRHGGLGISIIRRVVDKIEYLPAGAGRPFNILKLIKSLRE